MTDRPSSYPPTPLDLYAFCTPDSARSELLAILDELVIQMDEADSHVGRMGVIQRRVRMFEVKDWKLKEGRVSLPSFAIDVRRVPSFEQLFDVELDPRHAMSKAGLHAALKKEVDKLFRPLH